MSTYRHLLISTGFVMALAVPTFGQATQGRDEKKAPDPAAKADKDPNNPDLAAAAKAVVETTNAFRKDEGRTAVKVNDKLTDAAKYFAEFMAKTDEYGHEADGKKPAERATDHGYDYCIVTENIAYAFRSSGFPTKELADKFFDGWKNSEGHRKNMVDPDVTETGVAVARSEKSGYYYAVQMFGRPKSQSIEFQIANRSDTAVEYTIDGEKFDLEPRVVRTHMRCRPADVTFKWPEGGGEPKTVKPAGGERLDVTKEGDAFKVKTGKAEKLTPR